MKDCNIVTVWRKSVRGGDLGSGRETPEPMEPHCKIVIIVIVTIMMMMIIIIKLPSNCSSLRSRTLIWVVRSHLLELLLLPLKVCVSRTLDSEVGTMN